MATGSYVLAIDWDADGSFSDAHSDVTARTLQIHTTRGRNFASQLVAETVSGVLMATLNNESGDYSSFNTSSPIYGKILPGRKVKLTGNDGTTTYTLWEGFLDRIVPVVTTHSAKHAELRAVGPLAYLNRFNVSTEMKTAIKTGAAVTEILDEAGWPGSDRDIDTGITEMPHFWVNEQPTLNALRLVEDTETGMIEESADATIRFRDRHSRSTDTRSTNVQATYSDSATATLPYSTIEQADPLRYIFNDLTGELQTYDGVWILGEDALGEDTVLSGDPAVLWEFAESGLSSPMIPTGSSKVVTALSNTGVDSWVDLVATTDYTANDAIDGSGTDRTSSISVAMVKKSQTVKLTVTNGHSGSVYLTKLQARGHALSAKNKVRVGSEDATSQTTYGKRTFPHPGKFLPNTAAIQDWADFHLQAWKDPVPIIRISVAANRSTAALTDTFSRDLLDLVKIEADNNAGLGVDTLFFIESISHQINSKYEHRVEYALTEAEGYSGTFIVGSSSLGASTRLGY